jgi:hypothetical protein
VFDADGLVAREIFDESETELVGYKVYDYDSNGRISSMKTHFPTAIYTKVVDDKLVDLAIPEEKVAGETIDMENGSISFTADGVSYSGGNTTMAIDETLDIVLKKDIYTLAITKTEDEVYTVSLKD